MGIAERRARERETRRNQIMDAARKVFSIQGFGGSTMDEIAQAAELSPATIYLYFKNKYELYISLHVGLLRLMADKLEKIALREDLNPVEQIREFMEALYRIYEFVSLHHSIKFPCHFLFEDLAIAGYFSTRFSPQAQLIS